MAAQASSTSARIIDHPARHRRRARAEAAFLEYGAQCPPGVVRLQRRRAGNPSLMPRKTPELAVLTAILLADPALGLKVKRLLAAFEGGQEGEAGEAAHNFVGLVLPT